MVKVTVIGAGFIGEKHAQAVSDHPILELVSVVDTDQQRAQQVADAYSADEYYGSLDPALDQSDAAVIATPETHHADHASTALDHGVHILVEKPLTDDLAKARALTDRATKSDLVTATGFLLRYDPAHRKACEAARGGDIGAMVGARVKRTITAAEVGRLGERADPLFYISIHDIDLLNYAMDTPAETVTATERRGAHESQGVDIADAVQALVTFENGATAVVEGYTTLPEEYPNTPETALELTGTEGVARVRTPSDSLAIHADRYDRPDTRHWPVIDGEIDGAVRRQMDRFADAIDGSPSRLATITDGYRAQTVADAIQRAIDTGESVAVTE